MRTLAIACALLLASVVVAAPFALAAGGENAEKGKLKAAEAKEKHADAAAAANETATQDEKVKDKELRESFGQRMKALKAAFRADATGVREACHAAEKPAEGVSAWAHCVRDGYQKLLAQLKIDRVALKAEKKALA